MKIIETTNFTEAKETFKRIVSNTKKFNGSLTTLKKRGYIASFYHVNTGKLLRNIAIINENGKHVVNVIDYK